MWQPLFMERGDPVSWRKPKHCFGFTSGKLAVHQLTCYWLKSRNRSFVSHLIKGPDWQWNVFWGIAKLHKCGSPWAWEWIMWLGSQLDFTMNESSSFCSIQRTTNCTEQFFYLPFIIKYTSSTSNSSFKDITPFHL